MAFSNPQGPSNGIAAAATSSVLTVTAPALGQLLVATCTLQYSPTATVMSITDNGSAGWTLIQSEGNNGLAVYWWYKKATSLDVSSLTSVTFSWTNGSGVLGGSCSMDEYDGFTGTPTLDLNPAGVEANAATITITGGVATHATELALSLLFSATTPSISGTNTYSPNAGTTTYTWTNTTSTAGGSGASVRGWCSPTAAPATSSKFIRTWAAPHPTQAEGATFYDSVPTSVSPAAAPGTGVGVYATPTVNPHPSAAVGSGVGVSPVYVNPPAAVGTGAGSATSSIVMDVYPPASGGVGVGVAASEQSTVTASPLAAVGTGVGVNPSVGDLTSVEPLAASGTGVGVTPTFATSATVYPLAATGSGVGVNPTAGFIPVWILPPFSPYCLFLTPQVRDRPPYLPDSSMAQVGLMRHFENRLRGVSVWEVSDGTYRVDTPCNYESAQTQPAAGFSDDPCGPDETATMPGLTNSNDAYPWNPFPGSTNSSTPGSYAYNTNWDQTTQDFILDPYNINWWEGGAENIITQEQAVALTQAGFGDCIGPAPLDASLGSQPDGLGAYGSQAINA